MGDGLLERLMQKWQLAQEGSVLHSFALQCTQVGDRSFFVAGFVSAASTAGMIASSAINRLTFIAKWKRSGFLTKRTAPVT